MGRTSKLNVGGACLMLFVATAATPVAHASPADAVPLHYTCAYLDSMEDFGTSVQRDIFAYSVSDQIAGMNSFGAFLGLKPPSPKMEATLQKIVPMDLVMQCQPQENRTTPVAVVIAYSWATRVAQKEDVQLNSKEILQAAWNWARLAPE